jgi:methionyl-tRNA formyltransferase
MRIIALSGCSASLPTMKYLFCKQYLTAMICPEDTAGTETVSLETWASFHELPCWQVAHPQLEAELSELIKEIQPDLVLVYGFPHSISSSCLKNVKHGGWNVHYSLHPDKEASITIHQLAEGKSYGQIVNQCRLALLPTGTSAIDQLSKISVGLMQEAFEQLKSKTIAN